MTKKYTKFVSGKVCLVLSCFLFLSANTSAKARQAVTEWFYPYQIVSQDNKLSGYAIELANMLFSQVGEQGMIEILPWSVAYNRALNTPNLLIFSIGRNSIREKQFYWIGPVAKDVLYFFALHGADIKPSSNLADFKQYRITVVKDATTHQFLTRANFPNLYPMPATDSNADEQVRIKMLINKRADLLIASRGAIDWSLRQLHLPPATLKVVYRASPLDTDLYFAFNINSDKALVEKYQSALQGLKSTASYSSLKQKWRVD